MNDRLHLVTTGVTLLVCLGLCWAPHSTGEPAAGQAYEWVRELMAENAKTRRAASRRLIEHDDQGLIAGIVDALFFTQANDRREALKTLEALAGERPGDSYWSWVELVGRRAIVPTDGYFAWKVSLLQRIDPRYKTILYPGAPTRIRLDEVVTGGVRLDGIPSLDNPKTVSVAEASWLKADEAVFGVDLGGEQRAYPLRMLDWHEMLNDVVGGEPITLSYCTLCGSGILYGTRTPNGSSYTFGTSGLLYRSNKLMFDRQSYSLWSNLTGEPVIGRLARGTIRLEVLPLTRTTWREWSTRHPRTTTVAKDAFDGRPYGFDYRPGKADERRRGVKFPVWIKNDQLDRNAEVYALHMDGVAKAYPLDQVLQRRVINDRVGDEPIVLIADRKSGAVRAYRRGEHQFVLDQDGELRDEAERAWLLEEGRLVAPESRGLPDLERLPGHISFWFGWYAFYPDTEIYRDDSAAEVE